jgi:hypothetical protein
LPIWCQSLWKQNQMKGFMRQRGASWELRVYLGLDPPHRQVALCDANSAWWQA